MVTVTASGSGDILSIKMDPEAVDPDDGADVQVTPPPAAHGDPQQQIDALRAQVARLTRRLEDQP